MPFVNVPPTDSTEYQSSLEDYVDTYVVNNLNFLGTGGGGGGSLINHYAVQLEPLDVTPPIGNQIAFVNAKGINMGFGVVLEQNAAIAAWDMEKFKNVSGDDVNVIARWEGASSNTTGSPGFGQMRFEVSSDGVTWVPATSPSGMANVENASPQPTNYGSIGENIAIQQVVVWKGNWYGRFAYNNFSAAQISMITRAVTFTTLS